MPESLGFYVDDELEKLQNSFDNMAVAADSAAAARVSEEAIVRADADSAMAASITTVSTRVDDNEASIEFILETIDGNSATARLTVDVNGRITGFTINGQQSEFIVDASRFAVGDNGDYVFEVIGGVTYIKNAVIKDGTLPGGKLQDDAIGSPQIAPDAVLPEHINVSSLSAITATIGTLRTAATGARTEISDNLIRVFDGNNVQRVRLGVW